MAIFNSYVKLPEGTAGFIGRASMTNSFLPFSCGGRVRQGHTRAPDLMELSGGQWKGSTGLMHIEL